MEWVSTKQDGSEGPRFSRSSLDFGVLPAIQSAPSSVAGDSEEDIIFEEDEEDLPWHHQQLYKLYGKHADYFLHPKTEDELDQESDTSEGKFAHLINSQGAEELWQALRGQSIAKLASQNQASQPYLKDAYSAFVRQSIQHRSNRSNDNFFLRSGVQEAARLMDDAKIKAAQDRQRKVNLMYRTSRVNETKFTVLTYNNPLHPLAASTDQPQSVSVYMPSWVQQEHSVSDAIRSPADKKWSESQEGSRETPDRGYRKQRRDDPGSPRDSERGKDGAGAEAAGGDAGGQLPQPEDWSFIKDSARARSAKRQHCRGPRYIFLTEEAASEPGQFSKRRQETLDATNSPRAYMEDGDRSVRTPEAGKDSAGHSLTSTTSSAEGRKSSKQVIKWQPLTLNALVENKRALRAPGEGNFNHGKTPIWTVGP